MKLFSSSQVGLGRHLLLGLVLAFCLLLLFAVTATAVTHAAPRAIFDLSATPSWTQSIASAGSGFDVATDVAIAPDGAVHVSGQIASASHGADVSLAKIVNGVAAWASPRTYDSPYHGNDSAAKIALGPGDAIYLAGSSIGANGKFDVLLLKWSKDGNLLWARRYDGPGHGGDEAVEWASMRPAT